MVPGLVSRLAPVRPVTAVIKIKHAGLNLTGPLWPIGLERYARHALGIIPGETYREPQAASVKLQA